MDYLLLSLCWMVYFTLHSLLAADSMKRLVQRIFRQGYRYYRIVYSLISAVGLLAILFYHATISSALLFSGNNITRYLSMMIATAGVMVISKAFREHRFLSFIGLQDEVREFRRSGILKYVRHPIYSGTILIIVGFFLFNPTVAALISVGCVLSYLPFGIYLEEKKLIRQYGSQYLSYRREVPSIIPRIKKR